jgi:lipopolysaccharide export LptBFGC system permease protein LptF
VEINMVMGIVNLALLVLAMVLSAAPLPFSDQLGSEALHIVWTVATVFYFIASDYFQVVRLKGFQEFCKMFRGNESGS